MSIFDLVKASELVAYWTTLANQRVPYLGESLFPSKKKRGLNLKWIKGSKGLPVVLAPSSYDAKAKVRDRIGFSTVSANMPFFKESTYIDEEMRQELNMVLETNNPAYVESVMNNVFDDEIRLLEGARAQRERMRMQLLTTGTIAISANGQEYNYDYGVPSNHKVDASAAWTTTTTDIIGDIKTWQDLIEDEYGVRPTRAICDRATFNCFLKNDAIIKSNFVLSNGQAALTENMVRRYLMETLGLTVEVNTKKYVNEAGATSPFVPANTFVLIPEGDLGSTWFGTTPEESDLMAGQIGANIEVAITDTGVAVATHGTYDPVNVQTKVSMICLPSFEAADQIVIADVSGS